jgi:formylglycine-generating enzyme required for sulfatase activity
MNASKQRMFLAACALVGAAVAVPAGAAAPGPAAGGPAPSAAAPQRGVSADAKPGTVFVDCPDCPQMVVVPPGRYEMGRDAGEPERYEGPVRQIAIAKPFAAGRYEITTGQYRKFSDATRRTPAPTGCNALRGSRLEAVPGTNWQDAAYGRPAADDEPVACVTWEDAKAYATWLAKETGQPYRLLTEAEWEYVARAGRAKVFYAWGDDPKDACREANVLDRSAVKARPDLPLKGADCDDGFPAVAPVGRLQPNPFGLYDVIGNVWEWVEDCYAMPHPADAPVDGSAQVTSGCDRRSVRGGSWISAVERNRPTFRGRDPVTLTTQIFGFRIARDLPR